MSQLQVGDLLKYIPTSTVGKVTDVKEKDGKVWVRLDFTDLYYDAVNLIPADPSEYIPVSFKEKRMSDISEMMPSGGG